MNSLKLTKIGNSVGATFPKELLARMHVGPGDTIFVTEAPGGYLVTPYDPEFERQMTLAEDVMKRRRSVLRELGRA